MNSTALLSSVLATQHCAWVVLVSLNCALPVHVWILCGSAGRQQKRVAGKYARQGFMKVIIAQGTLSLVSDYMS